MNRKSIAMILLTILLTSILSACASAAYGDPGTSYSPDAEEGPIMDVAGGDASKSYSGVTAPMAPVANSATVERIVIKNASLEISVESPEESMKRISQMAEEMGGYVVSANMYQTYRVDGAEIPTATLVIRVPAERLTEALDRIKSETEQPVRSENITSQDVTADYTDLESRLKNLEAAEDQLQQIMDNAKDTQDVLNVYNQLISIREQIEVIKGQIKYYDQSAALSAVSVELTANAAVQPIEVGGWQPQGTVRDAIQALVYAFQALVDFFIWLFLFALPVLLAIVIPIWILIMVIKRLRRNRRKPTTSA